MHCLHTPGLMSLSSLLNAVQTVCPMSCGTSLSRSLQLHALVLRSLTMSIVGVEHGVLAQLGIGGSALPPHATEAECNGLTQQQLKHDA